MSLKSWADKGRIQKVAFSEKSLKDLLQLVERDLKDSKIDALSPDRRFATAYGAAMNLANYVIRREGYRVAAKAGHHKITFEIAGTLLGQKATQFIKYFDLCRRKRNKVDYDRTDVVSETQVDELIKAVEKFKELILEPN